MMDAWLGVVTSFCMIIGCFGMVVVLFCWDDVVAYWCTPYVQLEEETGEEDDNIQVNTVELRVVSSEKTEEETGEDTGEDTGEEKGKEKGEETGEDYTIQVKGADIKIRKNDI